MLLLLWSVALFPLLAGAQVLPEIENFRQVSSTETSITLAWDLDTTVYQPDRYTLWVDDLINQFGGTNQEHVVYDLEPCAMYNMTLEANFDQGNSKPASINATTKYKVPGSVGQLQQNGEMVSWQEPSNAECVSHYKFCWFSTETGIEKCEQVTDTKHVIPDSEGCDQLDITVTAVAGDATEGPTSLPLYVNTDYARPGPVTNFEAVPLTETSILLAWDSPDENPACVSGFDIQVKPVSTTVKDDKDSPIVGPSGQEFISVMSPLTPCTNFSFIVFANSKTNESIPSETIYQATNYTIPSEISDVLIRPSYEEIVVSWGDMQSDPCTSLVQVCYSEVETETRECVTLSPALRTYTITGLSPCITYSVLVRGISDAGEAGPATVKTLYTLDRAPGPVTNLSVTDETTTSLTVTYDPPLVLPQCVKKYAIIVSDNWGFARTSLKGIHSDEITTLEPCGFYTIQVYGISRMGLEGNISTVLGWTENERPKEPQNPSIVEVTSNSVALLWYPPENRYCADGYDVAITRIYDGSKIEETVYPLHTGGEVLYSNTKLSSCTAYRVEVRSHSNELGDSAMVNVASFVTLC